MVDDSPPTQPLPAKRQKKKESSRTTIYCLSDDLLLTIFLCLPSLATLIRATLTCRAWREMVASSPSFRRLFCEIHPAPLLGFFFNAPNGTVECAENPCFPSFIPVRHRDRDLAAAVRGGDFFLTSIQEHPDKVHNWGIADCRSGYILLANGDDETKQPMALLNPLVRGGDQRFLDDGHENAYEGYCGCPMERNACLVFPDEDPSSFKVLRLIYDQSRVRATIFSSDSGEWSIGPWVDVPARPTRSRLWLLNSNMQVNKLLYWVYRNHKYIVTFDTRTMKFSTEKLPILLRNKHSSFEIGETSSGIPCIFYAIDFNVGLFLRKTDGDGVERWMLDWDTCFERQLRGLFEAVLDNYSELRVVAVRDGFVYLAVSRKAHEWHIASWFITLCFETMKLEKLFQRSYDGVGYPYVMTWPRSLIGNFGTFALQSDA